MASQSFVFSRTSDPDSMANNFGPTGGKGGIGPLEGQIVMHAVYNTSKSLEKAYGTSGTFAYPSSNQESQDIVTNEYVYVMKQKKTDVEVNGVIEVLSNFNNEHKEASILFPNDWEMQKQILLNDKIFVGIARDDVGFKSRNQTQGLTVQVAGKHYRLATVDMSPGMWAYLDLDDPGSVDRNLRTTDPYVVNDKVVATVKPVSSDTYSKVLLTHLKNYFEDKKKWIQGMKRDYRTTSSWINFCETTKEFILMSFLLTMNTMVENEIIEPIKFKNGGPFDLSRNNTTPPDKHQTILGMAKAFSLLENTQDEIPNIMVTEQNKADWNDLADEVMLTIFAPSSFANFGFGWNDRQQRNMGVDPQDSQKIKTFESTGKMFYRQLKAAPEFFIALSDTIQRDNDRKRGKVNSSSPAGNTVEIVE